MSACVMARLVTFWGTPPISTVPVKYSVPSVGRLVSRTVRSPLASSPPPSATMKLPTTEAGLPPVSMALGGCPSNTLPPPETTGGWFSGVTFSVMVAWSEPASGVAPSLTTMTKLSSRFWSAPVAVCT
ncbi:hypothetical protein D9M72_178000 [compost metagenome]